MLLSILLLNSNVANAHCHAMVGYTMSPIMIDRREEVGVVLVGRQ